MTLNEEIENEQLLADRVKLKNFQFNYNEWVGDFIDEYLRQYGRIGEIEMRMIYKVMNFVEKKLK